MSKLKAHSDAAGGIGSIFTAACCLGLTPLLALLSALGLSFLINDMILLPLLIVMLGWTIYGLVQDARRHGRSWIPAVGIVAALSLFFFIFVSYIAVMAYVSSGLLMAAVIANIVVKRRCAPDSSTSEKV